MKDNSDITAPASAPPATKPNNLLIALPLSNKKIIAPDPPIQLPDPTLLANVRTTIIDKLQLNLIPPEVYVSTITANCKLDNFKFNCDSIAKYIDLNLNGIVTVSKDDGHEVSESENVLIFRTLLTENKKKTEEKKKNFFNQVSMLVASKFKRKGHNHVKLFRNGSIHITGCQSADDIINTLETVMEKLRIVKAIATDNKIVEIPFVSDPTRAFVTSIVGFNVGMINTNFSMPFAINLKKLLALLVEKGVEARFNRINHSGVNIKYDHPERKITILIFEKGSIVITGAQSGEQVATSYDFINKFLYANVKIVRKRECSLPS